MLYCCHYGEREVVEKEKKSAKYCNKTLFDKVTNRYKQQGNQSVKNYGIDTALVSIQLMI
jgi:hypothetical protein